MSPRRPSDDELLDPFGDELDLAETIARENPTADQLQHFAKLRGAKHALLEKQAPFVRNNPPSILVGALGNQIEVRAGEKKQVANWTGDDAETLPITVTLGAVGLVVGSAEPETPFAQRPYAIIQYGTRSSLLTLEVDIGRGCQFTLGASMVTVQVCVEAGPVITPGMPELPMLLSGMLSCHPVVRTQNITRTLYLENDGTNVVTFMPIPAFAKSLVVYKPNSGEYASAAALTFYDSVGQPTFYTVVAANTQLTVPIEMPGDAVAVTFTDVAGLQDTPSRFVFNLEL